MEQNGSRQIQHFWWKNKEDYKSKKWYENQIKIIKDDISLILSSQLSIEKLHWLLSIIFEIKNEPLKGVILYHIIEKIKID